MENTGAAMTERSGMIARLRAASTCLDANECHFFVLNERIEHSGRIAAAADAGDHRVWQPTELVARLLDRLAADDRLKVAHDSRKGMRPDDRPKNVVSRFDA